MPFLFSFFVFVFVFVGLVSLSWKLKKGKMPLCWLCWLFFRWKFFAYACKKGINKSINFLEVSWNDSLGVKFPFVHMLRKEKKL